MLDVKGIREVCHVAHQKDKQWTWQHDEQKAFDTLKEAIAATTPLYMVGPHFRLLFKRMPAIWVWGASFFKNEASRRFQ